MTTTARFDDLRPQRRRCFRLQGLVAELRAHTPDEVPGVLARAEAEVAAGRWVAGWVSYEAAPAFDDSFTVRDVAGTPFEDLPLAFFAVFERRERAEPPSGDVVPGRWRPTIDAARHARDVADIRERIARGETYQVNHTFRMAADFDADPADLYGRIAHAQRGGFGAFIDTGRWAVVSASPELFLDRSGDRLECRPMKGTARRGVDAAADEAARAGLLASAKDRAENLMIVDMVRNDLARVAVPGTVAVHDLFAAERYDTVWQLTSGVGARTRPGIGLVDVFTALFPCASITGAPRSSTMGIIAELETTPRGVYCGAIGFGGPGPDGPRWTFNVGIRTVLVDRERGTAWYGTGGGITHDSTAAGEFAEAVLKAEVLSRAPARFSLLETMHWSPDEGLRRWSRHRDRARASAAYFDIDWDQDRIEGALAAAVVERDRPARLRLQVDQQGVPSVEVADLPPADAGPVRVVVDSEATPGSDPFVRHKTTQRARYEAAAARHPQADDVVLVNERGEVTETTIANLAARFGDRWVTPPLESGCLPGTTRAELLAGGVLVEGQLWPEDLRRADELARFNAVRGWQRVVLGGT
ncbi:chorismate-binding protein [Propionibacteriaceae bacterium Y1923]